MGMFDEVNYTCPSCGEVLEDQTKLGECSLTTYHASPGGTDLPDDLICALAKQQAEDPLECRRCGNRFKLKVITKPCAMLVSVQPMGWSEYD